MNGGDPRFHVSRRAYAFRDCFVSVTERQPLDREAAGTLVFLHGRFGHAGIWDALIERLPAAYRAVRVDFPNFGRSFCVRERGLSMIEGARLVEALLEKLGGGRTVLVGHDVGGAIAQAVAVSGGGAARVGALVLVNSECLMSEPSEVPLEFGGLGARRMLRRLVAISGEQRLAEAAPAVLWEAWRHGYSRRSLLRALAGLQRSWPGPEERGIWREGISAYGHPVLMLWGARDTLIPPERAYAMFRAYPEAYFFQHDGCGHWPAAEDPEWVAGKMEDFLFRLSPGRIALSR